jgi:hypothetical protein
VSFTGGAPTSNKTEDINKWAREWPKPHEAQEKEQERKLLRQLANDFAPLNNRVIEVRHKAPPGLLTNATLGDEYRALEKDVQGAPGLTLKGIKPLVTRVNALRVKVGQVEKALAQAPNARDLVAWALARPETAVQNAMQSMRDALNLPVPDGTAYKAACDELGQIKLKLQQVADDYASLNDRVIEVRHKAPAGLLTNETLGDEYRAFEQDVNGVGTLTLNGINDLIARLKALRDKADKVEQVLAQAPTADTAIAWALGRQEPCVRNAMQRMRDALNHNVPDANAYTTAVDDLGEIKKDVETYLDRFAKLDYPKTLQTANKAEREKLETQMKIVDDAVGIDTPKAYANALPLLEVLAKLVETCGNAYAERERVLKKPRTECEGYGNRLKIALQRLKSIQSDFLGDLNKKAETQLNEIKLLMSDDGVVVETAVRSATDRLRSLTENAEKTADQEEKRVADELQLEADRKSYPSYKFDNCNTWAMQPVLWDKRIDKAQLVKSTQDEQKMLDIAAGRLGDHGGLPVAGFGYHCHMVDNGAGGIAFAYNHLGGNRVQPVIYDWCTKRPSSTNDYNWRIEQTQKNTAPNKPSWVKADEPVGKSVCEA